MQVITPSSQIKIFIWTTRNPTEENKKMFALYLNHLDAILTVMAKMIKLTKQNIFHLTIMSIFLKQHNNSLFQHPGSLFK